MKLRKTSFLFPFVLASLSATHAATITRSATADNLNLAAAWGGAVPTTADIATWDASSTLSSVMGANNTWGGLDVSAASGAVAFTGANALTLDNATDANTIFHTGTNSFTWGAAATAGNFHINGATGGTPVGSSASAGATFSGSGTVTISSTGTKNWSSNGSSNGVTNVTFTGTLALRGATIPAIGSVTTNWLALGGGAGAASTNGSCAQTGSFALDTGDATSCGNFILTHGWSGQFLKLNSLSGTGSIRADWGLSAGTQTRGIELDQSGNTTFAGSILAHNGSSQRRNVSLVKKGSGTLTLTGALGTSGGTASLNVDVQAGVIQLGNGTTNITYQNAAGWDPASTFVVGTGATLRLMTAGGFTWSRAITGGSGTVELSTDGDPNDGVVTFTANHSAFSGNINLNAGSLRMGPNLGTGIFTVKSGAFISVAIPSTNGTTTMGSLVLEDLTESDFRLGVVSDQIVVSTVDGFTVPASGGTHTINVFNQPIAGGTFTLIDYSGTPLSTEQFNRLSLGLLPPGLATYELVNNTANTSIDLQITLENQVWKGSTDGNWDAATSNWALASTPTTPAIFSLDNPAVFNDSAALFGVVIDPAGVTPLSTEFNNTGNPYTFTGGEIKGSTTLKKNGSNTVTLSQSNSYTGGTVISGGKLQIGSGGAAGDIGFGAVTIASGTSLEFNRSNLTPGVSDLDYKTTAKMRNVSGAGDIVLTGGLLFFNYTGSGTGFAEASSWQNFTGNLIVKGGSEFQTIRNGSTAMGSGDITLGDASTSGILSQIEGNWTWTNDIILVGSENKIRNRSGGVPPTNRALKIQGVISGAGALTLEDTAGTMNDVNRGIILTNNNTMSGTLTIATATPVRVGGTPGDTDVIADDADLSGSLGNGAVVNNGILTFSRTNAHTVANNISGSGALRIGIPTGLGYGDTSTQVLTFTGNATHTGETRVNNGTLLIAPSASMGGLSVTVATTAVLAGTGTVNAPLTAAGTLAPGVAGLGTLHVSGNAVVTGTLAIEVDAASGDKIDVVGDLDLTGSTVALTEVGAGFTAASYVIAECSGTLVGLPTAPVGYAVSAVGKQVVLAKLSGYAAWANANGATDQHADLDHDNDGIPNGVEYFMGATGNSQTPNPSVVNGKVTWPKDPNANATYAVQTSSNLQEEIAPGDGGWTTATTGVVDTGTAVEFTLPSGLNKKFVRLKVTIP